jgi:hypothetical protein
MAVEEESTYPVELIGNVAQHHRGAYITTVENTLATDAVVLIVRVATVNASRTLECVRGRAILLEAAHGIDMGLVTVRGVDGAVAAPSSGLDSAPSIGLLGKC